MVALNETAGTAVERELVDYAAAVEERIEAATGLGGTAFADATDAGDEVVVEDVPAARAAFVDEAALLMADELPAGTRREQLIIQIRLMNPGATREMLVGFGEQALQAYVDHLRLAMTPREVVCGRGRGVRAVGVPAIVRHLPDVE